MQAMSVFCLPRWIRDINSMRFIRSQPRWNIHSPVLDQSADIESRGHWAKCPLGDRLSRTFSEQVDLCEPTASSGKAVDANHQRLNSDVSVLLTQRRRSTAPGVEKSLLLFLLDIFFFCFFYLTLNRVGTVLNGLVEARVVHIEQGSLGLFRCGSGKEKKTCIH